MLTYLESLHQVTGTGKPTVEQFSKSKLEALLSRIGGQLEPKLFALMELTHVVRRLNALLLLGPQLDEDYRACAKETISIQKR